VLNTLLRLSLEDIPLQELLQRALDLLTAISWIALEAKGGIFLVEDQPEVLMLKAQNGLAGPILAACGRVPFGRCLCGLAASTRRIQFAADLDERHIIQYEGMAPHGHYCVPILFGERLLGVINLYVKAGHRRAAKEEEFLTAVANTLAGIIIRREAEEARGRNQREFSLLLENVPAVVFKGYLDGSIDLFDAKVEEMTGYPREEFDSRQLKWTDLILEDDLPMVKQELIQAVRGRKPYVREYPIQCKDGGVIWIQERSHVVCNPEGKIDYISGVLFDITKRKQGEEALRESEERFRAVVESAHDAIITADALGNIVFWNRAAQVIFGYQAEQVLGRSATLLMPEKYREAHSRSLERLRLGGDFSYVARTRELEGLRRNGKEFPLELSLAAWKVPQGTFFTAIIRDITNRKRVEEALKESEQKFRDIFDNAIDGILLADPATQKFFLANPMISEMLGYSPEELKNLGVMHIHPEEDLPFVVAQFEKLARQEGTLAHDIPVKRKDGSVFYADINTFPVIMAGKTYLAGFFRDITRRREAEEALKNSFAQLHRTLNSTVTALAATIETRDPYTAGHQRRVAQLACAIEEKLGFSEDYVDGMRVMGFLHDIGKIAVPAEILNKPGKISHYEFHIIKTHPHVGHTILKEIEFPWPVAQATLQHHERLDGSGYPAGLAGSEIILEARILAVADVVEAMVSHRPYRPALGIEKAFEEISHNRGILYDPEVVDACIDLFTKKGFSFDQQQAGQQY